MVGLLQVLNILSDAHQSFVALAMRRSFSCLSLNKITATSRVMDAGQSFLMGQNGRRSVPIFVTAYGFSS
jgi:hypothetical protein